jgi:hypothetical protein
MLELSLMLEESGTNDSFISRTHLNINVHRDSKLLGYKNSSKSGVSQFLQQENMRWGRGYKDKRLWSSSSSSSSIAAVAAVVVVVLAVVVKS